MSDTEKPRTPVILDTDIGDDIDDTWALAMLLGLPQIDLHLVVTAVEDTAAKTTLAAKILQTLSRTDVPLATGVPTGPRSHNQLAWVGDWDVKSYPGPIIDDGVSALVQAVRQSPEPVTILAIGPQTNLAAALRLAPDIAENARVVAMAGSVHIGYDGKPTPDAEYNIKADIPAARAVFAAPWDVTMTPLDTCGIVKLSGDKYRAVASSPSPLARVTIENYDAWARRSHLPPDASSTLFDTVAVYLSFDDSLCEMETVRLSIDDDGFTRPDPNGRPVRCALRWRDLDAFENLLVDTLTAG